MSVGLFGLAGASIAQVQTEDDGKRPPSKRTITAKADRVNLPEPR